MDYFLAETDPSRRSKSTTPVSAMNPSEFGSKTDPQPVPGHRPTMFRETLLKLGANFCSQTSMHGLGQVVENVVTVAKVVWFLAFWAALAANCYHISELVTLYMQRPVQERSTLSHRPIHFPAVTVCSQDPFSQSSYARLAADRGSRLYGHLARAKRLLAKGLIDDDTYAKLVSPMGIRQNIGARETRQIGHQLKDLILRCRFRGLPCDLENDFRPTINAAFYNCYTFDPGSKAQDFVAIGAENGLSLLFYLETTNGTQVRYEYDGTLNNGNAMGVKVMVHEPGLYPLPHLKGLDIMPGHSTSFGFYLEKVVRLSKPYGQCTNKSSIDKFPGYDYDTTVCLNSCLQTRTLNSCSCKNVLMPDPTASDLYCGTIPVGSDQASIATYNNTTTCNRQSWMEFSSTPQVRENCGCIPACQENYYRYTVTESVWPAPHVHAGFLQEEVLDRPDRAQLKAYTQLKDVIPTAGTGSAIVYQNFVRLNVYLADMEVLERTQSPAYPMSALFSDVGGTLGLWAGVSVLTLVEVIQLGVKFGLLVSGKSNLE